MAAREGWRSMRATRATCRWAWLGLGATGEAPAAVAAPRRSSEGGRWGGHERIQQGRAELGRSAAQRRGACTRLAASSSMPAAAWLENERGNSWNAMERGKHEHQ